MLLSLSRTHDEARIDVVSRWIIIRPIHRPPRLVVLGDFLIGAPTCVRLGRVLWVEGDVVGHGICYEVGAWLATVRRRLREQKEVC